MNLLEMKQRYKAGLFPKAEYIEGMFRKHAALLEYAELLRDTDIRAIEITDDQVTMVARSTGVKIAVDCPDRRMAPLEILNFDLYEPDDSDMMLRLIKPGDHVFDVGANIGWYSLTIARTVPNVRLSAFEPIGPTYERLAKNVALNRADNVRAYPFGFSDRAGEVTFQFDAGNSVGAFQAAPGAEGGTTVRARLNTLDAFVREHAATVNFIKCDVEGAELLVLRGGLETLRAQQPVLLLEMLRKWAARFGYHPNDIIDLLAGLGYKPYTAHDGRLAAFGRMTDETRETNFFFLNPARHQDRLATLA